MSLLTLKLLHHLHEILEQVVRVVRTRRRLWVILHAEEWQIAVPQPFERVVVQVNVRQFDFALRQGIWIDSEVVVMRSDFNFAGRHLLYGMIAAVMSELQFVGLSSQRDAGQLMSQANSEDWLTTHQTADVVDRIRAGFRITRAVRQKYPVRLESEHVLGWRLGGDDRYFAAFASQLAQDVVLDAVVVGDDVESRRLVFYAHDFVGQM